MRELNLSEKKNWNLKRIWIKPKSVSDFHAVRCLRSWGMRFQISYYGKGALFWLTILRLARLIFLIFLFVRNCFMCCLSVSSNEYFWIVGRIKLENHTVELTGLAYILAMSLTIFLASVVESQRRCHAKFRDRAWDKKEIVSMRRMACSEWPHVKYFGSLIILSELIDVSLVILTLNDA